MTDTNRLNLGLLVLRIGLAFVFLFFGFSQLHNPQPWLGFLPDFMKSMPMALQTHAVLVNGWFEIVAAVLLLCGAYTRITALLLALHLFGIAFTVGINPLGVRDIGLSIATLTLAIIGAGMFSIDYAATKPAVQAVP